MKAIMLRLTPVEALLVRHCLRSFFMSSRAGKKDQALARRIFDRIDEAYKE